MNNGFEKVLLKNVENPDSHTIQSYVKSGGYEALKKVLTGMEPKAVIEEVKAAGLRGRGGAGFPAGLKWTFAAGDKKDPKFIFCNADEGEPGTFKDRQIIMGDPHELIEGMIIAGFAVGASTGMIYIRGEYPFGYDRLWEAVKEAREAGYLAENILDSGFGYDIIVHMGAGAYVCGEETALIESLEGHRGQPRVRPPFPVSEGYMRLPTVVNNVETLSNVPHIINNGAEWFKSIGPENCPGPKIFSISGHVKKPGVYELPMGTSLKEIIEDHAGGIREGHSLKAVIPGGISTPILLPDKIDVPMDFDSLPKVDSMLGSGAIIVMDDSTCMVKVAWRALKFFVHESCGKCTPCRVGTRLMLDIVEKILKGNGAKTEDLKALDGICDEIMGTTFCPLGDGAVFHLRAVLKHFRGEFESHIEKMKCEVAPA
ncbi:MAG: NADH-quinone oxidoreductase subunit NuoF [Planctomycetota bacterium]|jgi:NADH-quinone oxidoreductase subunit F